MEELSIIRAMGSLLIVLGLIAGTAWLFKRYAANGRINDMLKREQRLNVVETCWLDPRHRLVLASCDGKEHLLLLGPNGAVVLEKGRETNG